MIAPSEDLVDQLNAAEEALFNHCGYAHDWRKFPVDDNRSMWWAVNSAADRWVRWSPKREAIALWGESYDYPKQYAKVCFSGEIYTYCHLKKWVFRGEKFTLVLTDTHCDGNIFLMIFNTDHEIKNKET